MAADMEDQEDAFNTALADVSNELTKEEIQKLVLAYKDIPRGDRADIKTGTALFDVMQVNDFISEDNVDPLIDFLEKRKFKKAAKILRKYKNNFITNPSSEHGQTSEASGQDGQPEHKQTSKAVPSQNDRPVDMNLIMKLSTKLEANWRNIGRYLNLDEAMLSNVESDCSREQEAKYQMLCTWKKSNGPKATCGVLAKALKEAGRVDLATWVENGGQD